MKFFLILCIGLLGAAGPLSAGNEPDPKIAELGEKMAAAASASEEVFRSGLQSADMRSTRPELLKPMPELLSTSAQLSRQVHYPVPQGCDGTLVFNWNRAIELEQMLTRQVGNEQADFAIKLETAASTDSAQLAKDCIAVEMQIPNRFTLTCLKSKRNYGEFANNLKFLSANLKRRSTIPMAELWKAKVTTTLFLYWMVRQNAAMLQDENARSANPAEYFLRQLNDVKNLSCCAFQMSQRSPVNQELTRKLAAVRKLCFMYSGFLRRQKDGQELQKYFADAAKLEQIRARWSGNTPYLFYWGDIPAEELGGQAESLLQTQLQTDMAAQKAAERQKRPRGKRGGKNAAPEESSPEAPPPAPGGAAPKADPFITALLDYNKELIEFSGNPRKEARNVAGFQKNMVEFAQILSSIAQGIKEVQAKYPDGVQFTRRPPATGK